MSAAMITADWFLLGRDLYYRKFEIYSMEWPQEIKLENFIVSSAPYGGPMAIRRDDQKFVKIQGGVGQPVIYIFSASGKTITSFKWSLKPIVHMGWSNDEKLICIQEDGNIVIYDMFGKLEHKFNIFQKLQDTKVIAATIFTNPRNVTGVAVLTSNFKVFLINSIKDIKTRQLSDITKSNIPPTCLAVISEDSTTEMLLARNRDLYRLKQDEHHTSAILQPDISNSYTSILEMAVSLNARHLCLYTDSGYLWLGSTDLRKKYSEIDTEIISKPKQLTCAVHLIPEIDGVRIVTNSQQELLQKVPDEVQKIFRINSTEPGSFLLEASKQFQKGSHKANEYICLVKQNLEEAVNQCLDAVGFEFDTAVQKKLIRAAQFGKCFIANMNSDRYVKMCRLLRVLNAIRDSKVGLPLTITQLKYMKQRDNDEQEENESLKNLLNRLITRNMYFLALQVARYLKMPDKDGCTHILVHWAKYKVSQHHVEEEVVAREIAEKLGSAPGISYRQIAEKASEYGKKKLAIKLLDYESKPSEQVELLLKLGENTPALVKAIESGDTDLIYMVILKLREKMPLGDFKMTIRNYPIAQSLYIIYCKEHSAQALTEIFIQEDDFTAQAEMFILESLDPKREHMKDSLLNSAAEAYKKGRKELCATLCEESLKLLRFQRDVQDKLKLGDRLVGKSVHETCKTLLELKEPKQAEKVKNDFKIPDRRYWWLKISSLASQQKWEELDNFSKLKKSPIGYTPFIDVCLEHDRKDEAMKYLSRVSNDLKVKYCLKIGNFEEAANIAFQLKDVQSLIYIQCKCPSQSQLHQKLSNMISQLEAKNR
ncbi:vacuolar protein sorting-associated protein 16 homolog isoform X2 [Cylas formicarius]|uniref:vacuolar protein sorting-associated protein 16 homolog isoform X2 n=1 Tax=Cylas formicarius TaxID=197179 RepID=UPI0029584E60|nr:vacuolar protein sorting-associated protein 16 homolog isoform X2 [Cylas formicarius]